MCAPVTYVSRKAMGVIQHERERHIYSYDMYTLRSSAGVEKEGLCVTAECASLHTYMDAYTAEQLH